VIAVLLATLAASTSVGVAEREWRVSAYRSLVPRGHVAFNVHNFGEDAHNLQVTGPGGFRSAVTPDVEPGGDVRLRVTLRRAGTYRLLCVKPGHVAKGMRASIRVR
jgi:plastocyanin